MTDRAGVRGGGSSPGGRAPAPDELDLACRDVVELVSDYLDGALDPPLAAAVERHLALCPPCVEYVRQLRQTSRLLGHLAEETLGERARMELLAAFREFRRTVSDP